MTAFEAYDTEVEVCGAAVQSIVVGVPDAVTTKAQTILADHGIENPSPEDWYPQQAYLDAYQMNHRGGDSSYYDAESAGGSSAEVHCRTPYPCGYDQALVKGTAMAFTDSYVTIEEVSERCRSDGGRECVYRVSW